MVEERQDLGWFWSRLDDYLLKANLKQSKQRNQIISYFLEMDDHVSAEDLHKFAKDKDSNAGMATIYRTLNLLKDAGLAEQKQFADGKAVFELNKPNSHHDHLICNECGLVIEFENKQIEDLQVSIANSLGFSLTDHSLDLYGQCQQKHSQCPKKN